MGIRVNNDSRSLQAQRGLSLNRLLIARNFERLSSGLRINRASDDAAGLAISTTLSGQVRGLGQAIRNAGDGISAAQTADAGLSSVTENLQRIRELSVQAANGTLTNSDRESIQGEIDQLTDEIGSISERTTFNGRQLLGGQAEPFQLQVGANANETVTVPSADVRTNRLGSAPETTTGPIDPTGLQAGELSINGIDIRATQAADDAVSTAQPEGSAISLANAVNDSSAATGVTASVNAATVTSGDVAGGGLDSNNQLIINDVAIVGFDVEAGDAGDNLLSAINSQADVTGVTAQRDASGGLQLTGQDGRNIDVQTTGNADVVTGLSSGTTTGTVTLQSDEQFTVGGTDPQDAGLQAGIVGEAADSAVRDIDVRTPEGANRSIEIIDRALEDVGRQRSRFGAVQNRLESTVNNLSNASVNLQESNSRIRDADFAKEAADLLRRQILEQAQISVLGQAGNLSRSNAIQLLGGP